MTQDYLNKLESLEQVSVPDFLLDGIKNKIEEKQLEDKKNSNVFLALAFVLVFLNIGVVTAYNSSSSNNSISEEINPYSFSESIYIGHE